jgi:hypothetical protein
VHLVGRALLQPGVGERVLVVRDDEPTSLVAYALASQCALPLPSWHPACSAAENNCARLQGWKGQFT